MRLKKKLDCNTPDLQLLFPVCNGIISSKFGDRIHPIKKIELFHYGIDIISRDYRIFSTCSGKIVSKKDNHELGAGKAICQMHITEKGDKYFIYYHHLSEFAPLDVGDEVKTGSIIGLMGNTGMSTGIHLHFQIMEKYCGNKKAFDPTPYFFKDKKYYKEEDAT
jgi:murein DD-endopeptidase MepM/ murein hydrolase activator NlpD